MSMWTVRTHHGTYLGINHVDGTIQHAEYVAPADQVLAYYSSLNADLTMLLCRSTMVCPGGSASGRILSYRTAMRDGMHGFIVPETGMLLSAAPTGTVTADRDRQGGWEMFELSPVSDADLSPTMAMPPSLRCDVEFVVSYAASATCDVVVLAALVRLLSPDEIRRVAGLVTDRETYKTLFPILRRHLSAGRPAFEWLTTKRLEGGVLAHGWSIGEHTYGAPEVIDGQYGELRVGRYCSIAGQVQLVVANHSMASVTSYPFAALADSWPGADPAIPDHAGTGIVIGNDVWIGTGACILPGARIGDGAVIGARTVVAGHVPAYAVVVGNPARVIRKRFSETQIERLLHLQWWCWPEHVVDMHLPLLLGGNVDAFLAAAESGDTAAHGRG